MYYKEYEEKEFGIILKMRVFSEMDLLAKDKEKRGKILERKQDWTRLPNRCVLYLVWIISICVNRYTGLQTEAADADL